METWLVILFLSRKKNHAKQIYVLTGFMKLRALAYCCLLLSLVNYTMLTDDFTMTRISIDFYSFIE